MLTFAALMLVVVAVCALLLLAWIGLSEWADRSAALRRERVSAEAGDAEGRLQQITRAAFEQMLDEARRSRP